jgi:hypothetical protein
MGKKRSTDLRVTRCPFAWRCCVNIKIRAPHRDFLNAMAEHDAADQYLKDLISADVRTELDKFLWGREIIDFLVESPGVGFTPAEFHPDALRYRKHAHLSGRRSLFARTSIQSLRGFSADCLLISGIMPTNYLLPPTRALRATPLQPLNEGANRVSSLRRSKLADLTVMLDLG